MQILDAIMIGLNNTTGCDSRIISVSELMKDCDYVGCPAWVKKLKTEIIECFDKKGRLDHFTLNIQTPHAIFKYKDKYGLYEDYILISLDNLST